MNQKWVTENIIANHHNGSRRVTFKKHSELPSQFLFYDHVTNVLALIMKDKAERNRELATLKKTV